jgi:hypothetical protein
VGDTYLKNVVHGRAMKNSRSLSLARLLAYVGLCLGAVVIAVALLILMFGGAILNGYGKKKMERAFAKALPGCALRIGELDYTASANRLIAQSVTLSATTSTLRAGRLSLTGVRWVRLLWGTASLADILAKASLDAANLDVEFPRSRYGVRCARLRASVPGSELIAKGTELRPLVGDEEFFAASAFRMTRFRVVVPECRVLGLAYGDLLQGKSYRARSVHLSRPSLDVLVSRYKPVEPFVKPPLMVHEALALIRQPLQVESLGITSGHLRYAERAVAGADPGVLTVGAMNVTVDGITNRGEASAVIALRAQGELLNAGALKVLMTIPVASPDLSLRYSGSLGPMDLTRLDAFLENAEHIRITSGSAKELSFEIDVTAGQARGRVRAIYKDLKIAFLDKQTGTEKVLGNRFDSFMTNAFKIRNSNAPDASGSMKEGKVSYTRDPKNEFLQFTWFALRSGVLDAVSL